MALLDRLTSQGVAGGKHTAVVSRACYNAAISACARSNRSELCLTLLRDMRSRIGLGPDFYTYGAVTSGLAKGGRSTRALEILHEMRDAGMEPDWVCLKAVVDACQNRGSAEEAGQVLRQVKHGLFPRGRESWRPLLPPSSWLARSWLSPLRWEGCLPCFPVTPAPLRTVRCLPNPF